MMTDNHILSKMEHDYEFAEREEVWTQGLPNPVYETVDVIALKKAEIPPINVE